MKDNYDGELDGYTTREFTLRGHTFRAKPTMPGPAFDDLADLQSGKPSTNRIFGLLASIISRTLIADDRAAWDALLVEDLDVPIETMVLAEIADDLVTAETGRPPQPLSPSTSSDESGSTTSTENSGSPEARGSTPFRSVPV